MVNDVNEPFDAIDRPMEMDFHDDMARENRTHCVEAWPSPDLFEFDRLPQLKSNFESLSCLSRIHMYKRTP